MITIQRPAPDEVNGQREKGYIVSMADTRNATFFLSEALNQDSDLATNSTSPRFRGRLRLERMTSII